MEPIEWQKNLQDIYSKVNARYIEEIKLGYVGALEYGKLIVQNLILLNGGGIASIPIVISILKSNGMTITSSVFLWSAGFFVVGILLALLCALLAYFNFHSQAFAYTAARDDEIAKILQIFGVDQPESSEEVRKHSQDGMNQYKIAHVFGWLALIFFCVGCFILANGVIVATAVK